MGGLGGAGKGPTIRQPPISPWAYCWVSREKTTPKGPRLTTPFPQPPPALVFVFFPLLSFLSFAWPTAGKGKESGKRLTNAHFGPFFLLFPFAHPRHPVGERAERSPKWRKGIAGGSGGPNPLPQPTPGAPRHCVCEKCWRERKRNTGRRPLSLTITFLTGQRPNTMRTLESKRWKSRR